MKLLYIASIDFFAKPNPSFHLMTAMISDLLADHNEIFFIGIEQDGLSKHIPDELQDNKKFHYSLIKLRNIKKSNFIGRFLTGIYYAIKTQKKMKEYLREAEVVFIQSSPTVFFNIRIARKLTNKTIIYNVQDMFPGSTISSGVLRNTTLQKVFYKMQKKAYSKVDMIVGISDDMKDKLIEQGVNENKIQIINNWYDDRTVHYVAWEDNRFVQKYSLSPKYFYVQYAGTMGYVFNYEIIIEIAKLLKSNTNIVFQMIGEGSQKSAFQKAVKDNSLENIVFLPLQEQSMVPDVYSACSVCFIPLKKGIIGNSVPSKIGLVMECKKPIITTADLNSHYCQMINENGIGLAFGVDDSNGVAQAISYLYENREKLQEMGENGYSWGKEQYSRTYNMGKYINLFKNNI